MISKEMEKVSFSSMPNTKFLVFQLFLFLDFFHISSVENIRFLWEHFHD